MANRYMIILQKGGVYYVADSDMGDQLETFETKEDAWLAARAQLEALGADPNTILDMTNAPERETHKWLR